MDTTQMDALKEDVERKRILWYSAQMKWYGSNSIDDNAQKQAYKKMQNAAHAYQMAIRDLLIALELKGGATQEDADTKYPLTDSECRRELASMTRQRDELLEHYKKRQEVERMLSDLTPGGSEFVNPKNCFNWIKTYMSETQRLLVKAVIDRRQAEEKVEELENQLGELRSWM